MTMSPSKRQPPARGARSPGRPAARRRQVKAGDVYRFLLELALLAGLGYWGWHLGHGGGRGVVFATALPVAAVVVWGVFATPGDPSRGRPVVAIPGPIRLTLECGVIGLTAFGVWTSGSRAAAETLLTIAVLEYALGWERNWWLLRH